MEKRKLDWHTFISRRRLNIEEWLKSKNIEKYEDLKEWCSKKEMDPPKKEEVSSLFKVRHKAVKAVKAVDVEFTEAVEVVEPVETIEETVRVSRKGRKKKIDMEE